MAVNRTATATAMTGPSSPPRKESWPMKKILKKILPATLKILQATLKILLATLKILLATLKILLAMLKILLATLKILLATLPRKIRQHRRVRRRQGLLFNPHPKLIDYFTAAKPPNNRRRWLVNFFDYLTRPTAGDKKQTIRLQHANQMRNLLEAVDPAGDDILCSLDHQDDAVWKIIFKVWADVEQFQGGLRESHSLFSESLRVKDVMEIMEEAEGLDINDENGGFSFQELLACETSAQTRWENCKRSLQTWPQAHVVSPRINIHRRSRGIFRGALAQLDALRPQLNHLNRWDCMVMHVI
ncbi:hypothetical protein OS493_017394 [Desmophyllum pertusum]|uniref:Uncharacterized protein n=1 Tax=Desmophyllum pertusum TaxID=174260 RepID=A0A9X0A1J8_9CNID|nr:hypothetical protein OS493_017394 [Desmophyllum pertusum]